MGQVRRSSAWDRNRLVVACIGQQKHGGRNRQLGGIVISGYATSMQIRMASIKLIAGCRAALARHLGLGGYTARFVVHGV